MIVVVWHVLSSDDHSYRDLGADYYERRADAEARKRYLVRELERIRAVTLDIEASTVELTTRPTFPQARILSALGVNTSGWDRAHHLPALTG